MIGFIHRSEDQVTESDPSGYKHFLSHWKSIVGSSCWHFHFYLDEGDGSSDYLLFRMNEENILWLIIKCHLQYWWVHNGNVGTELFLSSSCWCYYKSLIYYHQQSEKLQVILILKAVVWSFFSYVVFSSILKSPSYLPSLECFVGSGKHWFYVI